MHKINSRNHTTVENKYVKKRLRQQGLYKRKPRTQTERVHEDEQTECKWTIRYGDVTMMVRGDDGGDSYRGRRGGCVTYGQPVTAAVGPTSQCWKQHDRGWTDPLKGEGHSFDMMEIPPGNSPAAAAAAVGG